MKRTAPVAAAAFVAIAALVLGAFLWRSGSAPAPAPVVLPAPAASAPAPAVSAAVTAPRHYPAPVVTPATKGPPDVEAALADLFGRNTALSMFRLDDFPRRLAATVDNLGRTHAPSGLWPLNPPAGRFSIEERDGATYIGADNALRYTPYVLLLESVDAAHLVAVYARLYPLVQSAYEDLGYPKGYFNDRLIQVIDELLATPESDAPLQVRPPQISGPLQPQRPWLLYRFDDPSLEALPAGQKLLLRMGAVNERRVKARLVEVRHLLVAPRAKR